MLLAYSIVKWFPCFLVPNKGGFPLICHPNGYTNKNK